MQSYASCFSIHFHAISCRSKNTSHGLQYILSDSTYSVCNHITSFSQPRSWHLTTAWQQNCIKYPWHLTSASWQAIRVPASSSLPTLPARGGFSGHLTVLNFLFITFLSQGTHIKCSPLKCHTLWSDICTFFQLFRLKDFCIAVLGNIIKGPQIKSTISVLLSWAAAAPKSMAFH